MIIERVKLKNITNGNEFIVPKSTLNFYTNMKNIIVLDKNLKEVEIKDTAVNSFESNKDSKITKKDSKKLEKLVKVGKEKKIKISKTTKKVTKSKKTTKK